MPVAYFAAGTVLYSLAGLIASFSLPQFAAGSRVMLMPRADTSAIPSSNIIPLLTMLSVVLAFFIIQSVFIRYLLKPNWTASMLNAMVFSVLSIAVLMLLIVFTDLGVLGTGTTLILVALNLVICTITMAVLWRRNRLSTGL